MISLDPSIVVTRNRGAEADLLLKARAWVTREERAPGIHATDVLDPRKAFWSKVDPKPLSDRLAMTFFVGKMLHAFVLGDSKGAPDAPTDAGSFKSEELGITYSPDVVKPDGNVAELKTSRSFQEPKSLDDIRHYLEQLLVYMAATDTTVSELWVLYLNLRDSTNRTAPEFRVYGVSLTQGVLDGVKAQVKTAVERLGSALMGYATNPDAYRMLPLCREWMCNRRGCDWFDVCRPEGRYTVAKAA